MVYVMKEDCGVRVLEACQPLPPVHLLHQVRTYQEACSVEAMRAVNTFKRIEEKINKLKTTIIFLPI